MTTADFKGAGQLTFTSGNVVEVATHEELWVLATTMPRPVKVLERIA